MVLPRRPHDRAVSVFGESTTCGYLLGLGTGVVVVALGFLFAHDGTDPVDAAYYGSYIVVAGGGLGMFAGLFGGALLYAVVRCGEPRLGPRIVARVIPVVALTITVPLAVAIGLAGDTAWFVRVVTVDVVFTVAGSWFIAHRYFAQATS